MSGFRLGPRRSQNVNECKRHFGYTDKEELCCFWYAHQGNDSNLMTSNPSPRLKILLVDDEADLLDLFAMSLRRKPYDILKASSGAEALALLQTEVPALIVLDVAMPEISGLEVLHAVRGDPRLSNTKILILTAVPLMVEKGDAKLADMVLPKPVTPLRLEETIWNLIGTAG